jgi:pyruvate, water dikinase
MSSNVRPVDDEITNAVYPGFKSEYLQSPWVNDPIQNFSKSDEDQFWFLDFHWPRGFSPMGMLYLEDGFTWGSQYAARDMPLPTGNGLAGRLGGTYLYSSMVPVTSKWEMQSRGARLSRKLTDFLVNFQSIWENRVWELENGLRYFEEYKTDGTSLGDLHKLLVDARSFQRRAWEIHFEMMYPLLANYLAFNGICGELKIDTAEISKFLQGYDTKILACDRALWRLTEDSREMGVDDIFAAHSAEKLEAALKADERAGKWLEKFDRFLNNFGWRTTGISDINLAPWIEDPTPALGNIKSFLSKGDDHNFSDAHKMAIDEREQAVDSARSKLTKNEQRAFDAALASCQKANFAWWNEEHNYYIDLRATIPLRKACLAIGKELGAEHQDDTLFLFWPEMMDVLDGRKAWGDFTGLISERRDFYQYWLDKRHSMPKIFGTIPESVTDPILLEVFGLSDNYFEALRNTDKDISEMTGVPASSGCVRGIARVLHSADELHNIKSGDILVCEATTPSWTAAFAKIAACVCDGGGILTHASIISREYRIPCVVGVGVATNVVQDGDEIEVDGNTGIVKVFKKAA